MGKITKQQLSDGLLEYIASKGGSNITFKKKSVVISKATDNVAIGIQGYNKNTDLLMVYKNTVYLEEDIMYTVSSNSNYINNPNGNWEADSLFNFIVIKNNGSGSNNPPSSGGNITFEIADGSITEVKLDENVKNKLNEFISSKDSIRYKNVYIEEADLEQNVRTKLNEISSLKETVRYKNVYIEEADLSQNLKERLNISGAKTWGSLKNEHAKTWANLMGR